MSKELTLRSMLLGAGGSVLVTASSMYVALRMGALPWPTIFVAILSFVVLKALGKTNLNEVNVTHTAMSAGGLVAGGVAFTIPGIWMVDKAAQVSQTTLLVVALSGTILGLVFTGLLRRQFIEAEKLPYPLGIASSQTLIAGDQGGKKARLLFGSLGASAVFTAMRDQWALVPASVMPRALTARNVFFGMYLSPMAMGIGYIIGPLFMGTWLLGSLIAYFGVIPLGIRLGFFPDVAAATAFKNSLGIGLIVGSGIGVLVRQTIPRACTMFAAFSSHRCETGKRRNGVVPLVLAGVALALTGAAGINLICSVLTIAGTWVTTAMAATITGQTGIDPMEVFGILVLLAVKALMTPGMIESFLLAAVVAIACGLAGDALQDFKAGHILGTSPKAQMVAEAVGGLVGAVVSVLVLGIMRAAYGAMGPGTELVAPQAYAVSTMVQGLPNPSAFAVGLVLGGLLNFAGVPGMTIGIGMYLPMPVSTTAGIGGLVRYVVNRRRPQLNEAGTVISSGLLGGEGFTGVLIALARVISRT
ncbi:MAG: OPT/YSL family transporter [Bacillota bacterium]